MVTSSAQAPTNMLLLGGNGQVGHALQQALAARAAGPTLGDASFELHVTTRADLDLCDFEAVRALVRRVQPQWIVNAAAYTAVDAAQSSPEMAHRINASLPGVLAEEAQACNAALIHYSTDYVFDGLGHTPYTEADLPNPQSVYGHSKWLGEQAVVAHCARHVVLRTSWVFGAHGGNFLKTMLRLAQHKTSLQVVADQWGAPTSAALLARLTLDLIRAANTTSRSDGPQLWGTYHASASGVTNWHGYACEAIAAAQAMGMPAQLHVAAVEPIPSSDYPTPAPRPANSRMDNSKLAAALGYTLPEWRLGMHDAIHELAQLGWDTL
jgi:dTDP-4-dehydrorhamnose reductase